MNQNLLPAHLQNRRGGLTNAVSQGLSSGAPPYISIAKNRFTLIDAAGNERPLQTLHADVVIVQANPTVSKVYYDKPFDPSASEFSPPACFSDNGIGPSRQSQKPQSPTCAACPNNVWGSDVSRVSGKATKACNDVKKIAVVLADSPDMPFLLRVPPASLKHLSAYVKTIAAQNAGNRQVEVSDVVTRVTFDPQVQGVLNFAPVGWIDERTAAAMDKIWDAKAADDLVGLNDTPYQGPIGLGAPAAQPHPQGQLPPPPQPLMAPQPMGSVQMFIPPAQPAAAAPSAPQVTSAPAATTPRGRGRPKKDAVPAPAGQVPAFMQGMPATQAQPPATQQAPGYPGASQSLFVQAPAVQAQPVQATPADLDLPAFLRRPDPSQPQPAQAPARFGMVDQAPQPNAELNAAIERAMNLPLPKGT